MSVAQLLLASDEHDEAIERIAHECGLHVHAQAERQRAQARLLVAQDTGHQVLGFLLLWVISDEAEVIDIGVTPAARRQGIAAQLLRQGLVIARDQGAGRVFLEVRVSNQPAIALYQRFGFEETSRRRAYYSDGEDALLMSCCVGPTP